MGIWVLAKQNIIIVSGQEEDLVYFPERVVFCILETLSSLWKHKQFIRSALKVMR